MCPTIIIDFNLKTNRTSASELRRLGANASWMLGKWDSMEDYLEGEVKSDDSKTVILEENISFFRAILAIHNHEYDKALSIISDTRNSLSGSISSFLSESFSRAYRAMVTMQVFSYNEFSCLSCLTYVLGFSRTRRSS
jgi:FKBP12-rapamycin complex-associated protein